MIDHDERQRWAAIIAAHLCGSWGWLPDEPEALQLGRNIAYSLEQLTFNTGTSPEALLQGLLPRGAYEKDAMQYVNHLLAISVAALGLSMGLTENQTDLVFHTLKKEKVPLSPSPSRIIYDFRRVAIDLFGDDIFKEK